MLVMLVLILVCVHAPAFASFLSPLRSLGNMTEILRNIDKSSSANSVRLLVVGGWTNSGVAHKEVDVFHVPSGTAANVTQMATPRCTHGTAVVDGLVYAVGGYDERPRQCLATVDVYVPLPYDRWLSTTPMSTARAFLGVCAFEGKIYAIGGGCDEGASALNSSEVYDPETALWTPIKSMTIPRVYHAVGVLRGLIYAVGGFDGSATYLNSVERYDPGADQWTVVSSMETHRYGHSIAVLNEKLYAIGGYSRDIWRYLKSVEIYDARLDEWSHASDLPSTRGYAAAASFGDLIYVAGGYNGSFIDSAVLFDHASNTWNTSTTMRLSVARSDVSACVLYSA